MFHFDLIREHTHRHMYMYIHIYLVTCTLYVFILLLTYLILLAYIFAHTHTYIYIYMSVCAMLLDIHISLGHRRCPWKHWTSPFFRWTISQPCLIAGGYNQAQWKCSACLTTVSSDSGQFSHPIFFHEITTVFPNLQWYLQAIRIKSPYVPFSSLWYLYALVSGRNPAPVDGLSN